LCLCQPLSHTVLITILQLQPTSTLVPYTTLFRSHYNTGLEKERLLALEKILEQARQARDNGASRFCMGAAWKNPSAKDFPHVLEIVREVRSLGMETCMTLGALTQEQADDLADAGLDYYNHNLDTSPEYYASIITTRTFQDRLDTLGRVRNSGM